MSTARDKNMAKKAVAEAEKEAKAQEEQERREAAEWQVGAKVDKKADSEAERDRKLRLKAETAALLEAEEAGVAKKKVVKKKGKDAFDLLDAAIKSQPKTKAQREAEAKKAADEERKKKELEARVAKELQKKADEQYAREMAAKGINVGHHDDIFSFTRDQNVLPDDDEIVVTGIESAIDALSVDDLPDAHPEKRRKALYNSFLERMLPVLKDEHPGLRLNQYKERIFELWKVSPENPVNMAT